MLYIFASFIVVSFLCVVFVIFFFLFFPDGIDANVHGPFSKSFSNNEWSIFSTGLQLDLVMNQMVAHLLYALDVSSVDVSQNCVANPSARVANGIQIFPGSVPIYRNNILVGAIGYRVTVLIKTT